MTTCKVGGCHGLLYTAKRGLCLKHDRRFLKWGTTDGRPVPTESERFWSKVAKTDGGCWNWSASLSGNGYGTFYRAPGDRIPAHRYSYIAAGGTIPDGLFIDHLCRNRACVNPEHLEPVTQAENNIRGFGWSGLKVRQTHCLKGHEFTPANTYRDRKGARVCRECHRITEQDRRDRRRAERMGAVA